MAWRLNKSIVRGEMDNREDGRVRGRIWLLGRDEPIVLELAGNCLRDLAGCVLHFENPQPAAGDAVDLDASQEGIVGDMTASRKVRVLEVPVEEAMRLSKAGQPVPEHMGNAVYLEWFSEANGRVVIESTGYSVRMSDRVWTMTEDREREQAQANHEAIRDWLDRLTEFGPDPDEDGTGDAPMDEFEWEKFLKDSDKRTDKYMELLEKYGDHPDSERLIAREMGWTWLEEALEAEARGALPLQGEVPDEEDLEPLEPNPETEGVDWVRDEGGYVHHPLTVRARDTAMEMWHHCKDRGLLEENGDDDLQEMLFQAQTTGAKLAGALNGLAYHSVQEGGFIVALLKRALTYLNNSLAAADRVEAKNLLPPDRLKAWRQAWFEIREEMLALMQRFRKSGE